MTSFGVHAKMVQSFSKVNRVIFLFFLRLSSVLLSMPDLRSLYWEIPFFSIVFQSGSKLIMAINSFEYNYKFKNLFIILCIYPQCDIVMLIIKNGDDQNGNI